MRYYMEEIRTLRGLIGPLMDLHAEVTFDDNLDTLEALSLQRLIELEIVVAEESINTGEVISEIFN